MNKISSLLLCLLLFSIVHAQYKVKFVLKEKTSIKHDSIYITGTFNNWDSQFNKKYLMQSHGPNEKSITLALHAGKINYKFSRGNWFMVEKKYDGDEVPDRVLMVSRDTSLTDSVEAWRDQIRMDKWYRLSLEKADTNKVAILASIATTYAFLPEYYNSDSALFYAQKALQLQQRIMSSDEYKSLLKEGNSYTLMKLQEIIASLLHSLGNYPKALEIRFENLKLAENEKDKFIKLQTIRFITSDYIAMKDYENVLRYGKLMESILRTMNAKDRKSEAYSIELWWANKTISIAYYNMDSINPALVYANKITTPEYTHDYNIAVGNLLLADIYAKKGDNKSSFYYYKRAIPHAIKVYSYLFVAKAHAGMARLFQKEGRLDSALNYALQSLHYFQNNKIDVQAWGENSESYIAEISPLVAELYKSNKQPDSAYKYLRLSVILKDSLYNDTKIRQFQTLGFNEANRRKELEDQKKAAGLQQQNKIKMTALIAGMAAIFVVAFLLYRNNKHKQKANTLLHSQKQEIENTLGELKTTQNQLIQSEKMASLGELTAGIAHEIQNPLNFVNNFSEVNKELIDEMQLELDMGNINSATAIAKNIKDNEEKITHHGKRADAIVKGMLQHSRSSSGAKEPTDINALCDEYLRLAYHGLRAKDKSFNATMKTDFDDSLEKINIIPQDIGRVILNLITNAFYAVNAPQPPKGGVPYDPTVSVSTKRMGEKVEIKVRDNGPGIPKKILDKIFQPFFTTKPSGQGTGLGLSLSYDIVKAHGGELKVETIEGEYAEFIISIPVNHC